MRLLTDIYLNILGVTELIENAVAVVQDKLGKKRPRTTGLAGKTAIVTGGNAGVGYATAEALLAAGSDVVLAVRSLDRGQAAAARLAAAARSAAGKVEVEALDLASLDSVRSFVRRWQRSGRQLDLLVCNAGIMCPPERLLTPDGFELQFQSNYLAHFELANRLVAHQQRQRRQQSQSRTRPKEQQQQPKQQQGQQTGADQQQRGAGQQQQQQQQRRREASGARPLRVVWLTSMTHFGGDLAGDAELADAPYCSRRYRPFQAYANSKLCTLLAAKHLDRIFARDAQQQQQQQQAEGRDVSVAVHPGLVYTFLATNYFKGSAPRLLRPLTDPFFERFFCPYLLRSPEAAAETVLYAATAPAEQVGGRYCGTAPRVGHHSSAAGDPALARRVWEMSAHLCQLSGEDLIE